MPEKGAKGATPGKNISPLGRGRRQHFTAGARLPRAGPITSSPGAIRWRAGGRGRRPCRTDAVLGPLL